MTIFGIDLAWGDRMPDAIVRLENDGFVEASYTHGDEALLETVTEASGPTLLAIDAPTLCVNETGSRPVDQECSALFRKFEAGCHPVNLSLCERPMRLAGTLRKRGFSMSCDLSHERIAMEVYPHPAMVRWFALEKTIKYKKGKVAEKRNEFSRYQRHFRQFLRERFPEIQLSEALNECLASPWCKKTEDLLDAHLCALIGHWHWKYQGELSQILGDPETGQMMVPMASFKVLSEDGESLKTHR